MTDQEVLSEFMEPGAPADGESGSLSIGGWWRYSGPSCNLKQSILVACDDKRLRLGLIREIEERLTTDLWDPYRHGLTAPVLSASGGHLEEFYHMLWHAPLTRRSARWPG